MSASKKEKSAGGCKKKAAGGAKKEGSEASPLVLHSSFTLCDLPAQMSAVYQRTLHQLIPKVPKKALGVPELLEEVDGATIVVDVESKSVAEAMFKALQNRNVNGRRWKVEYHPVESVIPKRATPTVVEVMLNPPGLKADVHAALQSVKGFLAVDEPLMGSGAIAEDEEVAAAEAAAVGGAAPTLVKHLVATFAEEGPAIHARAVLSGRQVGNHGSRMFLTLRRKAPAASASQ